MKHKFRVPTRHFVETYFWPCNGIHQIQTAKLKKEDAIFNKNSSYQKLLRNLNLYGNSKMIIIIISYDKL